VQHLAVDAQAQQHVAECAGPEPELVAVPAAGEGRLGRGGGERAAHVGVDGPTLPEPARRDDPAQACGSPGSVRDRSPVQQHLAEPGHVADGGAQPAVVHRGAQAVVQQVGVVLGAHRRPDQRGDQLGHGLPGGALAHPAQHVGFGGPVQEPGAVRRLGGQRGQEPVQATGLLPVALRLPADPLIQPPDVGLRVGVLLTEPDPAAHVQHVPHGGAGVAAGGEFGDVVGDRAVGVEQAVVDEHGGHAPHDRLGHRHQRVRPVRRPERAVPLGDQLAVLHHRVGVGVGVREDLPHRAGRPADPGRLDAEQIRRRCGGGQRSHGPVAAWDTVGRQDLADMPERPSVHRRVLPVEGGDRYARNLRARFQRHSPNPSGPRPVQPVQ
jgi:hypothetical protein